MYSTIEVYQSDNGAEPVDVVERKVRTDHEDNDYVRYNNNFYRAHGRITNRYHRNYGEDQTLEIFLDEDYEKPERTKSVFSSHAETAHAWAHHHEDSNNFAENGDSGDGRVYYRGNSIYSYGSHFEMARILWDVPGQDEPVVLINNATYSSSTSGHQSHVSSAIPHHWTRIGIPAEASRSRSVGYRSNYTLFDYGTNEEMKNTYLDVLQAHADSIRKTKEGLSRKRKVWTLKSDIRYIKTAQAKALKFIEIFQCKSIVPDSLWKLFNGPAFDSKQEFWEVARRVVGRKMRKLEEQRQKLIDTIKAVGLHDNPEELVTSQLRNIVNKYHDKIKANEWYEKIQEKIGKINRWKAGDIKGTVHLPSLPWGMSKEEVEDHVGKKLPEFAPVYLRYNRDKEIVETTKYAKLPVEDVRKAYLLFERYGEEAMEKSEGPDDFIKINGRVEIGHYTSVPAVNSEGTFRFGCHDIIESEREYIVKQCEITV